LRDLGITNGFFLENNVTSFDEAEQYCLGIIYLAYLRLANRGNKSYNINTVESMDMEYILEDIEETIKLGTIPREKKVDFKMEYLITFLKHIDINVVSLEKLCFVLLQHEKFGNYYNESIKIELINVLLGKIIEKKLPEKELLKNVQEYLTKNKKSSILLSKYAALYKVLSL
jgi:hypothetical protein